MGDVVARLLRAQRRQDSASGNPLIERDEAPDALSQLRLSDEKEGDQKGVVELEIQQQSDLLEETLILDVLPLLNDEYGLGSTGVVVEEDLVNLVDDLGAISGGVFFPELIKDSRKNPSAVCVGVGRSPISVLSASSSCSRARVSSVLPHPDSLVRSAAPRLPVMAYWSLANTWAVWGS